MSRIQRWDASRFASVASESSYYAERGIHLGVPGYVTTAKIHAFVL
jgi:hypothetical protein